MAAIWGLVYRDFRTVTPTALEVLSGQLPQYSVRLPETISQDGVSLGQHTDEIHGDSSRQAITSHVPIQNSVITAMGRLDNRLVLCRSLGIPYGEETRIPDRALIQLAYERWGLDCTRHLLGDWAFALWDGLQQRLLLARDQTGRTSLYYHYDHTLGRLTFSSALGNLVACPEIPRCIEPAYIIQHTSGIPRDSTTAYRGIYRLLPGYHLVYERGAIDLQRYWSVLSVPEIRFSSSEAYIEKFLDIYIEAIRCRLSSEGPIGTFLSGGLDSGSVATLAARELAKQGKRIHAFSAVPLFSIDGLLPTSRMGDESALIESVTSCIDNVDLTYVRSEQTTILAGMRSSLEHINEPIAAPSNAFWVQDILQKAHSQGIKVLLSGDGGNLTVSYQGKRREAYIAMRQRSGWREIASDMILFLQSKFFHLGRQQSESNGWQNFRDGMMGKPHMQVTPIINPHVVSDYLADKSRSHDVPASLSHSCEQARILNRYFGSGAYTTMWNWAAAWGIEVRDPTMDRRVVEFCLGIPQDLYVHRGQNRMLIRRAMADRMPDLVLWNRRRGAQSADIVRRVIAQSAEINAELHRLETSPLARHYLNLNAMRFVFEGLNEKANYHTTYATSLTLLRGLLVGLFLLSFENAS